MKWPTKLFFALVIGVVVSLVAMVSRQSLRSPRQVLQEVQAELQTEGYDERALLRRLAGALARAEAGDKDLPTVRELCADLRIARGRILLSLGATDQARDDFAVVLRDYRPGDRDVRRLLIAAESAAGKLEQALAQLEQLLRDEPAYGPAWVEVGRLEQELAEEALASCDDKLRTVLIEEEALQASAILRSLAARDPGDAGRATSIVALRELFPVSDEESLGQILGLTDEASEHFARCRQALVRSFSIELDPLALTRYLEILVDSGRTDEALDLGSLVAQMGPEVADPESAMLLIRTLLQRGDHVNASQLASRWVNGSLPLSADFLRLACEALYRGKLWAALAKASFNLSSIGSSDDENLHNLYFGLVQALSANQRPQRAVLALTIFARSSTPEPFEGARELAWREIAKLKQEEGDTVGEREALQAALAEDGPEPGELWLRRAEIQRGEPNNGYRLPLESWANAMNHLPQRTDELLETFVELGEQALAAEERSMDVLYHDLRRDGFSIPRRDYGPYVLYRLAQLHGEAGTHMARVVAADQLLSSLPDFVPALDELILARRALGDREHFIDLVLRRIELTGLDETSQAMLATIRLGELSSEQLVRVMQADPRGTGRLVVASWLAENGRRDEALTTLAAAGQQQRSDAESLFGARVQMDEGRYRAALEWLDRVAEDSPLRPEALRMASEAAMRLGDAPVIVERVGALLQGVELAPQELLRLADGFLENGNPMTAELLLERLPPAELPTPGAALLRQIQAALLGAEPQAAAPLVERAGAFLPESSYLAARVLLAAEAGAWSRVEEDVEALRKTDFADEPLVSALLDLLAGQDVAAGESAAFALSVAPDIPRWVLVGAIAHLTDGAAIDVPPTFGQSAVAETELFLFGPPQAELDPRRVAALLLLAQDPQFTPYLLGRLSKLEPDERGQLWPQLLAADHLMEAGRKTEAARLYRVLVQSHGECEPAWDALEVIQIERYGNSLHPQLEVLREARMRLRAEADPQGEAAMLVAADSLAREGDLGSALRLTLNAEKLAPDWYESRHAVARMYTQLGDWEPALESWRGLVQDARPVDAPRAVQGFLEALRLAAQADPPAVELETIAADLERLEQGFPDDPLVVLAQARLDLKREERNSALALERAWSRLMRLRERTDSRPLEELGRGATQAWAEFYVDTDPDSAEDFLLAELALQPGNLQLWRLLGRVHRDLGRFLESYQVLTRVSLMAPSAEVQVEIARTFVAQGAPTRSVMRTLQQADRLRGAARPLESHLLVAEALLNDFRPAPWEAALEQLDLLWDERHGFEESGLKNRLAALYGRALLLRDGEGDAALALEVLGEEFPQAPPPYRREHFAALAGIARSRSIVSQ